jgi:hypothetical protein
VSWRRNGLIGLVLVGKVLIDGGSVDVDCRDYVLYSDYTPLVRFDRYPGVQREAGGLGHSV